MTHDEDGGGGCDIVLGRELVLNECGNVSDNLRGWSCQSLLRWLGYGATPSSLIPAQNLDSLVCELGEKVVVAIDVLAEAVDKNNLCLDWAVWLKEAPS